jgi:hypothetical protein
MDGKQKDAIFLLQDIVKMQTSTTEPLDPRIVDVRGRLFTLIKICLRERERAPVDRL